MLVGKKKGAVFSKKYLIVREVVLLSKNISKNELKKFDVFG